MDQGYCDDEKIIDGFNFIRGNGKNVGIIVVRENEWSSPGIKFRAPVRPIEDYIEYINRKQLIEAIVWTKDISFLEKCPSLKSLEIENCGKIKDFSVLEELTNLEELVLFGNNTLPDLKFLNQMKNLKIFAFDLNVEDGNLKYCLNIPTVQCCRCRRHYNVKEKDLPVRPYKPEKTEIEEWGKNCTFIG